jgi:hypothetical protein
MKKNEQSPVNTLLSGQTSFIEIVITAILIGFGISLTVSSLTLLKNFDPMLGVYIGSIICIISLVHCQLLNCG